MRRCAFFERGVAYPLCHYQDAAKKAVARYDARDLNLHRLATRVGADVSRAKKYGEDLRVPNGAYEAFTQKGRILVCTTGGRGRCECYRNESNRQTAVLTLWKK